jgi:ferredoxin-NADP reductase
MTTGTRGWSSAIAATDAEPPDTGHLAWQRVRVLEIVRDTARVHSLVLDAPAWRGHLAGQHVDLKLTAEDGYAAERSYSIASAPEDPHLVLTIERLDDGEVSPYLVDELQIGDELELRGPIGEYFVWTQAQGGPLLLIAGGSGVVPFRSMLRHYAATNSTVPVRLLYSARTLASVIYKDELDRLATDHGIDVRLTLTRERPDGWTGYARRIDAALVADVAWPPADRPLVYICGPNAFVEVAANTLVRLGHDPMRIRTERFGPTG